MRISGLEDKVKRLSPSIGQKYKEKQFMRGKEKDGEGRSRES